MKTMMLSVTKVKLDLISDVEMYLFLEKGMRGGVSYFSKRYRKGNNKYLRSYEPKKPTKYITYLDKNNLYYNAMPKSLRTYGFKWLDPAKFNVLKYDDGSFRGSVLEVDLKHTKELHELHSHYQ